VAATKQKRTGSKRKGRDSLRALTAAALALPGLMVSSARAAPGDEFSFEYQHYQEGERNLDGQKYRDLNLKPIQVDSLAASMTGHVTDRVNFELGFTQDTWSGATPVTTVPRAAIADQLTSGASRPIEYFTDAGHNPVAVNWSTYDGNSVQYAKDPGLVHIMASASPETRRQVNLSLGYEWDEATLKVGGGASVEHDYRSMFVNMGGSFDFDQKQTTVSYGLSFTHSNIAASLEANTAADWGNYQDKIRITNGQNTLYGNRNDVAANVGLTQVLNKNAVLEGSVGFTRSTGYLSNPYKAVMLAFDDPNQFIDSTGLRTVVLQGVLEQRPTSRTQVNADLRYVQYIESTDGSLHLDYRYYDDDWGISAHSLELSWYQPIADGWMIVPGARYYTQTAASFYQPYFLFNQAFPLLGPPRPDVPRRLDFSQLPIDQFSSDERLSGFGTLSGQLAVSKELLHGIRIEFGAEYSSHAGALKLGGRGEGSYADFSSYTIYTALKLDLAARAAALANDSGGDGPGETTDDSGASERQADAPAGVHFNRMLGRAHGFRMTYRFDYSGWSGSMLHGSKTAGDDEIVANGCPNGICTMTPQHAYTHTYTVDLLYAPADWMTLDITPQFLDTHMALRDLEGAPLPASGIFHPGGPLPSHSRTTGGLGDTLVTALFGLVTTDEHQLQADLGISVPTGSVSKRLNISSDFTSYSSQLGSGTWDIHPSLTYTGQMDRWSWGAQISGVKRLQSRNSAGYALGDAVEATGWTGRNILDWLSVSLRGDYISQGSIKGAYKNHLTPVQTGYDMVDGRPVPTYEYDSTSNAVAGPMDSAASSGGHYWNVGFGLSAVIPDGQLQGNRVSIEWLQPVEVNVNGYQLRRQGTFSMSWSIAF